MSEHSDILGELTNEQLHEGIRVLDEQIRQADEENRTADAVVYVTTRNAIHHELEVRSSKEEGGTPARQMYTLSISAHHVLQILSIHYPDIDQEELIRVCEYDIRTMWNQRGQPARQADVPSWPEQVPYVPIHSSEWPAMRVISPLAIIHAEKEPALFTNAAPPLNAWWAAEDRIADQPAGTWELVWREHYKDSIHEGWIQRVSVGTQGDFLHYLTRYKGGEPSPLPLQ